MQGGVTIYIYIYIYCFFLTADDVCFSCLVFVSSFFRGLRSVLRSEISTGSVLLYSRTVRLVKRFGGYAPWDHNSLRTGCLESTKDSHGSLKNIFCPVETCFFPPK